MFFFFHFLHQTIESHYGFFFSFVLDTCLSMKKALVVFRDFFGTVSLQLRVQKTMATFMQRFLVDLTRSDLLYVSLDFIVHL